MVTVGDEVVGAGVVGANVLTLGKGVGSRVGVLFKEGLGVGALVTLSSSSLMPPELPGRSNVGLRVKTGAGD